MALALTALLQLTTRPACNIAAQSGSPSREMRVSIHIIRVRTLQILPT